MQDDLLNECIIDLAVCQNDRSGNVKKLCSYSTDGEVGVQGGES